MKKSMYLIAAIFLTLYLSACGGGGGGSSASTSSCSAGSSANSGSASVTALSVTNNVTGKGVAAVDGNTLNVNYTGWLYNASAANDEGAQFANGSITFALGAGQVIPGWDQGLVGMKVGGTRTLIIPSSLAYGACPSPGSPIPPNSALVFTVTLVSIGT